MSFELFAPNENREWQLGGRAGRGIGRGMMIYLRNRRSEIAMYRAEELIAIRSNNKNSCYNNKRLRDSIQHYHKEKKSSLHYYAP